MHGMARMPPLDEQEIIVPRVKVAIKKSTRFQGQGEEFSNIYTYEVTSLEETYLNALVDAIVAFERPVHGANVTFMDAKVWDIGTAPNFMRVSRSLSGVGTGVGGSNVYKECAYLCSWPLPRRFGLRRTIRRDLRKFVHSCIGITGDVTGSDGWGSGATPAPFRSYMDGVAGPVNGDAFLVAPNGDRPTGPGKLHQFLEHRQFPRGRKEKGIL